MKYSNDSGGRENYFPAKLKKDKTGDCVIRAIAIATDTDYLNVWQSLFKIGLESGHLPNDKRVTEPYLNSLGWVKHKPMRKSNGKKYKVKNLPVNKNTSYILHTSKHWTAIVNNEHRDTWNCGEWCANSYYTKQEGK